MRHHLLGWTLSVACAALTLPAQTVSPDGDPRNGEVPLPAAGGWNAFLVHDAGVGVWTVKSFQVFDRYGCPELVGMDEEGRCTVLVSYSGKWTPNDTVKDGRWLAPVAHADVDPRHDGKELYTAGQGGNVYRIHVGADGELHGKEIAHFAEEEIHTVVADDLRPEQPGDELLVFLKTGAFYELEPAAEGDGFEPVRIGDTGGRVRDALVMDMPSDGRGPWIVTVSRAQEVARLRLDPEGYDRQVLLREPMGFGRVCRGKGAFRDVLYVTRDDGVVLRLGPDGAGGYSREIVYAGPQGLRGVVAGRFTADQYAESIAVFGYSAKVQLLSRKGRGAWKAETIFVERDRGHWLTVAEVDGRNHTDEIVASGYAGRIVLLSRPPGYGFTGVATDPDAPAVEVVDDPVVAGAPVASGDAVEEAVEEPVAREDGVVRVGVALPRFEFDQLQPLSYRGGFESKTAIYETLVTRDPTTGALAQGLARSWRVEDDGRTTVFTLREDAEFHYESGRVDADAVVTHLKRWVGQPEHAWLRSSDRIVSIEARGDREVVIRTDEPVALLPDLCAVNPCAVRAPSALDREGRFVLVSGSGRYALSDFAEDGRSIGLVDTHGTTGFELVCLPEGMDPLDGLATGAFDVVASSYLLDLDPVRAQQLAKDPRFTLSTAPGSAVRYLSFSAARQGRAGEALRHRVVLALDREALVRDVEAGLADPCTTWAAPSVTAWAEWFHDDVVNPAWRDEVPTAHRRSGRAILADTLRLLAEPKDAALAEAVARQLETAGIPARVSIPDVEAFEAAKLAGDYDLLLEHTWGVPYDPYLSLVARFATPPEGETAASDRSHGVPAELRALVDEVVTTPREADRQRLYRRIQSSMDEHAWIIPLYARQRIQLRRSDLPALELTHDLYRTLPIR